LMTNKNKPKVSIVTGIVKRIKTGLTIRFNKPNTMATIKDVVKESTVTPVIK
jgi:hypothetical protein